MATGGGVRTNFVFPKSIPILSGDKKYNPKILLLAFDDKCVAQLSIILEQNYHAPMTAIFIEVRTLIQFFNF
jgi:hypothetical protein